MGDFGLVPIKCPQSPYPGYLVCHLESSIQLPSDLCCLLIRIVQLRETQTLRLSVCITKANKLKAFHFTPSLCAPWTCFTESKNSCNRQVQFQWNPTVHSFRWSVKWLAVAKKDIWMNLYKNHVWTARQQCFQGGPMLHLCFGPMKKVLTQQICKERD